LGDCEVRGATSFTAALGDWIRVSWRRTRPRMATLRLLRLRNWWRKLISCKFVRLGSSLLRIWLSFLSFDLLLNSWFG
jgi:hypothetical protein